MKENVYEDEYSKMWIENGIGYQVYKKDLRLNLDIAKDMVKKRIESFNGIARPVFVDARNLVSVDENTRKYFGSEEASELIIAGAVLIDNPINKWLGNVFLILTPPPIPAKLFTNKYKAFSWLEPFKYMN